MAVTKSKANEPERLPVIILFAETRGFTRTSEMLQPSVVFARVSEFFTLVQAAVDRQKGDVCNRLNDTLMASFSGSGNAEHAIQSAQEIQRDFPEFEETWEREYGIRASVAIGIHAGNVVTGTTADSVPGQPLILGDSISVAERLLHRARAGEFVFSKPVMDALSETGFSIDAQELPPLVIPRREPIQLFGVLRDSRLDFT